jgi:deferrochelatase/peroxidase EfeB
MNADQNDARCPSRRGFLAAACGFMAAAGADVGLRATMGAVPLMRDGSAFPTTGAAPGAIEPFYGTRQGGILTPAQRHTYFAAFDLVTTSRDDIIRVLQAWTLATARMTNGKTAMQLDEDPAAPASDTGEALGLPAARLTVTFGFGPGLFIKDGKDRYGLAARRPQALVDMPKFNGDQLVEALTGGDLSVQACADDPQVAFHAVRQLARLAEGVAQLRWAQTGFLPNFAPGQTPRNLMGFKDGTRNPSDQPAIDKFVWVSDEGPDWIQGGSYLVVRRIRIALEHWDRMKLDFQEQTIGRHKYSGAPLGAKNEFDPADLDAIDKDGNPIIPDNAHLRLAAAASNDGARILRRPYSYNDGVNFTSERWPPWRQAMEYDAGLLFVCYQRDPRTGFMKIFDNMSKMDMLNQFVTHTGGGLFACPGGALQSEFIGQRLFKHRDG